jgi:two-component system, NtrC family, response regulator HydG
LKVLMKKALIIDDEPIINRLNRKILASMEIESEASGSLECLKGSKFDEVSDYDIVIIDLNLIDKNKGKALEKIKSSHKDIPVLITSGYLKESANEYLTKYERIDYIQKPYTMEDFLSKVKRLLEA